MVFEAILFALGYLTEATAVILTYKILQNIIKCYSCALNMNQKNLQ